MIDSSDDRLIQNILLDATAEEYAAELASTEDVVTSPHFQRQMKKMLANPNSWAKQRKRPLWKQCLSRVAMLLLVCSLTLGAMMVVSPTVRATVVGWVVEWYETHISYRFFGESNLDEMPSYNITKLPSGYKRVEEIREIIDNVIVLYENEENDVIYFKYSRIRDGIILDVSTENMEIYEVNVDNHYGHFYLSTDPQQSNTLIWFNEQEKIKFIIDGFCDKDELLTMAESLELCNVTK